MRCLLAVHGSKLANTQDTIDSLLPLFNGAVCDVVVAAPEQWDLGVLTVGMYSGELDPRNYGFRLLALVNACWQANRTYDMVVLTDDRCLALTNASLIAGFRTWFEQSHLGLVGVADEHQRYMPFEKYASALWHWGLPYGGWKPNHPPLLGGVLFFGRTLLQKMFDKGLMPGRDWQQWPTTFGDYAMIVASALKEEVFPVGTSARPRMPLFVAGEDVDGRKIVAPNLLRPEFAIFHPLDSVYGVSEYELRNAYKERREGRG